jgi:hypothetical protein
MKLNNRIRFGILMVDLSDRLARFASRMRASSSKPHREPAGWRYVMVSVFGVGISIVILVAIRRATPTPVQLALTPAFYLAWRCVRLLNPAIRAEVLNRDRPGPEDAPSDTS